MTLDQLIAEGIREEDWFAFRGRSEPVCASYCDDSK